VRRVDNSSLTGLRLLSRLREVNWSCGAPTYPTGILIDADCCKHQIQNQPSNGVEISRRASREPRAVEGLLRDKEEVAVWI